MLQPPGWRGSVINMSFILDPFGLRAFSLAILAAHRAGIPVAVAAGNQGRAMVQPPCEYTSPSTHEFVMSLVAKTDNRYKNYVVCVAACTKTYRRWVDSNFGRYVRIFAPGEDITSFYNLSDTSMAVVSGTSAAVPAVAAAMAIWVSYEKVTNRVATVLTRLDANLFRNVIEVPPNSATQNDLINIGLNNNNARRAGRPYVGAPARPAI